MEEHPIATCDNHSEVLVLRFWPTGHHRSEQASEDVLRRWNPTWFMIPRIGSCQTARGLGDGQKEMVCRGVLFLSRYSCFLSLFLFSSCWFMFLFLMWLTFRTQWALQAFTSLRSKTCTETFQHLLLDPPKDSFSRSLPDFVWHSHPEKPLSPRMVGRRRASFGMGLVQLVSSCVSKGVYVSIFI